MTTLSGSIRLKGYLGGSTNDFDKDDDAQAQVVKALSHILEARGIPIRTKQCSIVQTRPPPGVERTEETPILDIIYDIQFTKKTAKKIL